MQIFIKFRVGKIVFSFIFIILMASFAYSADSAVKIGVLAKRGAERCLEKWSPTAEYLTENIPGKTFVIVPIAFDQIYTVVENGEVDFILANSSFYVELESWFKVSRIATLKNKVLGVIDTKLGGVIFCKKQREDIRHLIDLKGKTFMAAEEISFGGWRMAWRELKEAGIDPFKNFASLSFGGTHDAVIYAVRDGKVDAGTVRTDTLERMNAEGKIRLDDFYIIHEHGGGKVHLPFVHSTREYPEWPIAKLKHTSNEMAEKVAVALIGMPQDSAAAQTARCAGWTIPLNYQSVHDCLKELKVGPYKDLGKITLTDVFRKYWILILIDLATLVVLVWFLATHIILNRKIKKAHKELELEVKERKQAAKALRESEGKYRLLIENQKDMLVKFDPESRLQFVSPSYCDTFGKTQEKLLGKKFIPLINEDYRKVVEEAIASVFKPPYSAQVEVCAMTKEGWRWQEWHNTAILNKDNEVEGVVAVGRDIDERKQAETALIKSEKQFKDLFNSITDLIYTHDLEGRFISLNLAVQKAFGYEYEEFIGHKASDLMKPELRLLFDSEYLGALKMQGNQEGISSYLTKNGEKIYIEYHSSMVHPDGEEPYISGTGRDVTERVLSERKVAKLQEQLTQAQKMESIGTLAGGIAHDFNNILFPIFGYLEMILTDIAEDSPLRGQLVEVLNGAKRARDLVQQILTFSRQKDHEMKALEVHLVIREALQLIKSSLPSTIEISKNIKTDCGLVMADSSQIRQVVMNLCTNAYHAMEKTGGKLTVYLKEVELALKDLKDPAMIPGKYVCLTVADTGIGVEQNIINRIFDPYFTTKETGKGTGMGLSITHGIVKSHGGHISVYSEPGKGTEFKVYLPMIKKQEETAKVETETLIQKGDERILLVDDQNLIVDMEKQMLERLGYHITPRTSSIEALEAFRANPDTFDLVITDMTMPNMTGDQLAGELIKIRSDIPIILCTGFSELISKEKAEALGIKGFLLKPVVIKDLSSVIREVLDGQ